jgi:hypothetical protein
MTVSIRRTSVIYQLVLATNLLGKLISRLEQFAGLPGVFVTVSRPEINVRFWEDPRSTGWSEKVSVKMCKSDLHQHGPHIVIGHLFTF